jgi:Na+/melibiose symporter-like transporter
MTTIVLKGIVIWLVFILAESLNGAVRIFWLVPFLGDPLAHQVSFFTASALVLAIATLFVRWLQTSHFSQLLGVGVLWLVLTILFEIALGRLVFGYSWQQIGADYNLLQGGLMPLGSVWLMLSPVIAAKIRRLSPRVSE